MWIVAFSFYLIGFTLSIFFADTPTFIIEPENEMNNEPVGVHKLILPASFAERTFTIVAEDGTETTPNTFINADGTVTLTLDLSAPVLIHLG